METSSLHWCLKKQNTYHHLREKNGMTLMMFKIHSIKNNDY